MTDTPQTAAEALEIAWAGIEANASMAPIIAARGRPNRAQIERAIARSYVKLWPQFLRLHEDKIIVAI